MCENLSKIIVIIKIYTIKIYTNTIYLFLGIQKIKEENEWWVQSVKGEAKLKDQENF